jgi:dolichol-phosphate mannosyltransferase
MSSFVVIPTYNERENIRELCQEILALGEAWHIVVVDDNSPDGTAEEVERLAAQNGAVHLLRRPGKLGFASADMAGFQYALEQGADRIVQMDADFSHDPQYLPDLLAASEYADIVIGSRYVKGGGTLNWGLLRRILSRGANLVARILLSLPVHDCTAGFRCYRRAVLENFDFDRITVEGYSFLVEMTYLCHRRGYRFAQVPIIFADRERGRSKISKRIIFEAMGLVLRLFLRRWKFWTRE